MSNSLNVSATATDIVAKLSEAAGLRVEGREASEANKAAINAATLGGYAVAAVAIRTLLDQGAWTTGKQKGGVVSASAALKAAVESEAKANEVSPRAAKRLIETAAAVVVPGGKAHVPSVHVAAAQSSDVVLKAFAEAGFVKEADILKHVEPPVTDVVAKVIKAITKLEGADRKGFVRELVNHEIIDDILAEASTTTAEERLAARQAKGASAGNPAAKAAERRKAKEPKAPKEAKPNKEPKAPAEGDMLLPKRGKKKAATEEVAEPTF